MNNEFITNVQEFAEHLDERIYIREIFLPVVSETWTGSIHEEYKPEAMYGNQQSIDIVLSDWIWIEVKRKQVPLESSQVRQQVYERQNMFDRSKSARLLIFTNGLEWEIYFKSKDNRLIRCFINSELESNNYKMVVDGLTKFIKYMGTSRSVSDDLKSLYEFVSAYNDYVEANDVLNDKKDLLIDCIKTGMGVSSNISRLLVASAPEVNFVQLYNQLINQFKSGECGEVEAGVMDKTNMKLMARIHDRSNMRKRMQLLPIFKLIYDREYIAKYELNGMLGSIYKSSKGNNNFYKAYIGSESSVPLLECVVDEGLEIIKYSDSVQESVIEAWISRLEELSSSGTK